MKRLLLGGVSLVLGMPLALADNTDTGSVSVGGTIVAPLTASASPLVMPNLVRPSTGEPSSSVTLGCHATTDATNTVTYTGNGNPFAHGVAAAANPSAMSVNKASVASNLSTGQCAGITIGGEANYFYKVVIGLPVLTPALTGVTLATGGSPCTDGLGTAVTNGDIVQLSAAGAASLRCGAKVTVTASSTATSYAGSYAVTITYD